MNMCEKELDIQACDILTAVSREPFVSQRALSEVTGHSLGVVNRSIKKLISCGYLTDDIRLTDKSYDLINSSAPKSAVILAAGFGMRMVPINLEFPKAMLEVKGERLIERLIRQLHEAGVTQIYVVVGFMKEQFEYLIDEYGVELIVNPEYARKNNMYSLKLALSGLQHGDGFSNTYVVPCDLWCSRNPFGGRELYSWYMVSDQLDPESDVRVNRKMELVRAGKDAGNAMVGIAYLRKNDVRDIFDRVETLSRELRHSGSFWEEALYQDDRMTIPARVVSAGNVTEVNTYEQLRELDSSSHQLQSDAISVIAGALGAHQSEITDITVLKKGMTNRSFLFSCKGRKYIMRIPGEGTDQLINRAEEAAVYEKIAGRGICDDPVYISSKTGYKITAFLDGVRVCDPLDVNDLKRCMEKLKAFHGMKLKVNHEFDIFGQIEFYESLWQGKPSMYRDYEKTKANVWSLRAYIDAHTREKILTHIDANHDNFLFYDTGNGEQLQLTDWEYAGMQDPDVDIAMFCIYALYNKQQVDQLISIYYDDGCSIQTKAKIYCYIAACGLLWSNWCEYKSMLGVEFGEYSLQQYRFAKDYYKYAMAEMKKAGEEKQ